MKTMKIIVTLALIILISGTAAARIEPDWQYGTRNPLPDDPSYIRYDFEDGGTHFNSYAGVVNFMKVESGYPIYPDKWGTATVGGRGYHIYPKDFFHNLDGSQVDYIYVVNGQRGALPLYWWCHNVKCEWWPGDTGRIEFPNGASDISFLISNGAPVQMKAYDKTGKFIGSSGVAYRNIERVPPDPSNFTRVSFKTEKPIIRAVEIIASNNNFWIMDDLVIGSLTFPDEPVNYTDVARLAEELYGVRYLEYGLGYDYVSFEYLDLWQFHYPYMPEYWNPELKKFEFGEGISDEGLIVWAYNKVTRELHGSGVVKWSTEEDMMKHDFTVSVESADTIPGDVYFMDHDFDEKPDWVGMVVEETDTGMNLIGSYDGISEGENIGVIYSKKSTMESSPAFMGYYRLPGVIRGGHNPIPKGH